VKRALQRTATALSVALLFSLAACSEPPSTEPFPTGPYPEAPLLLLGVDGLEWDVVLELVKLGDLPVLAGLMRRGVYGSLDVDRPTLSPVLWTTAATGHLAAEHGISGFVYRHKKKVKLFRSFDRRRPAFWNLLGMAGQRVATVGWWLTWPAEEVNGIMVSQANTITNSMRRDGMGISKGALFTGLRRQVWPPAMEASVLAVPGRVESELDEHVERVLGRLPADLPKVEAVLMRHCRWALRADETYRRVALDLMAVDEGFDLLSVYFGGSDVLGHRFWRYAYPQQYKHPPTADMIEALGDVLHDYYRWLDTTLGELIAAGPANANVVVVSDHGMHAIRPRARFASADRIPALNSGGHSDAPDALLIAAGPSLPLGDGGLPENREQIVELGRLVDLAPSLLALRGLPYGLNMTGRPMPALLSASFAEKFPLTSRRRWTSDDWRPSWTTPLAEERLQDDDSEQRLEQLRSLGYIK